MLTGKEQKVLRYYEEQLQVPRVKYIIIHGLIWGILLIVFMTVIEYFIEGKNLQQQWEEGLLFRILFMPLAGLLYGWINRRLLEKRYRQLKQRFDQDQ